MNVWIVQHSLLISSLKTLHPNTSTLSIKISYITWVKFCSPLRPSCYNPFTWLLCTSVIPVEATAKQSSWKSEAKATSLSKSCLYTQVDSSIIHNSYNVEATQLSTNGWMDKQNVHIHTMEYYFFLRGRKFWHTLLHGWILRILFHWVK